jgi:hypothetical protein
MKNWSISTTLRSPDRVKAWTEGFKRFEGESWNKAVMVAYQSELIRLRAYKPMSMTPEDKDAYEDSGFEITNAHAQRIFESQNYKDAPMRGRQSMSVIRWLGLVRVSPEIRLTEVGKALVDGSINLQDALLNYALKWEVSIPGHDTYRASEGFAIRPFVGMLALIRRVNELWTALGNNPVGLSRDEFNLFVPTLIDYKYVDEFAQRIVDIRTSSRGSMGSSKRKENLDSGVLKHLQNLPHATNSKVTETDLSNLKDYGDNAVRYFRPTGFIEFRGSGRFVDLSRTSKAQADLLIDQKEYTPSGYSSEEEYLDYVGDLRSYTPPWATATKITEVKNYLRDLVKEQAPGVSVPIVEEPAAIANIRGEDAEIAGLKKALVDVALGKLKAESRSEDFISKLIEEFDNLKKKNYTGYLEAPVALEYAAYKAFLALNDALAVQPNYPLGDDGEPISTAPGGGTDLYCDYETFSLSVEVTLSRGRSQWVMEGQPVQRHLRDVEGKTDKPTYGLFLAPTLYPDTINTFWAANVIGYEGKQQKIIPLNFESWQTYLHALKPQVASGELKHAQILKFFEWALPTGDEKGNSLLWAERLNSQEDLMKVAVA